MTEPLLNAEQAGALLNVPASWVLQEARADRIPHIRLGRYVRFEALVLEAWWRGRARGPIRRGPGGIPGGIPSSESGRNGPLGD